MKDMLAIIHEGLVSNPVILDECGGRIKFYIYPETGDTSRPFITIRPLEPPVPANYASDINLSCEFAVQIDVQAHGRDKCKLIQKEIKTVMEALGFSQKRGGLDTYFEETKRFVDARRYVTQTKIYDNDY